MKAIIKAVCCILIVNLAAFAANYTVKSNGSGDYTSNSSLRQLLMSSGDTCTVYAGTYDETVTVPAGTAGNYNTITVNGSDIVSVLGFTLNSHTKLIGNCPTRAGHGDDNYLRLLHFKSLVFRQPCLCGNRGEHGCLRPEQRYVRLRSRRGSGEWHVRRGDDSLINRIVLYLYTRQYALVCRKHHRTCGRHGNGSC